MSCRFWWTANLALLVALCACSGKKDGAVNTSVAPGQAAVGASGNRVVDTSLAAKAKNLGALVDLIVAGAADLPREEFDPPTLAKRLGKDPRAHFEWVRDHTWWAPYRGLLRGSNGVMLDRIGSNLDRAVLLGDLLRHAGHTVRLAHAQLPEDRARELLGAVRPIPDRRRGPGVPQPESTARERQIEAILPGFQESLQQQIADSKRRSEEAARLARSQAEQLRATVRDLGDRSGAGDGKAIAAIRDHWWVEREANGRWIAMDVLLPDGAMGNTLVRAAETNEWKSESVSPLISAADWHTVRIRVVVERYEDGATTESAVLESVLRPAEVFNKPITLIHAPKPWPENLPDPDNDPNALGNAAVNVKEWVPILRVGDTLIAQSGFTEGGVVIPNALDSKRNISEVGGGGLMGGFDSALGGGESVSSYMTAEWIDYEISVPGEASQRVRRPVFDVLGPAKRSIKGAAFDGNSNALLISRYEALLSRTDILLQSCEFTEEFIVDLALASVVANQTEIRKLSQEGDPAVRKDMASRILRRIGVQGPLLSLAQLRSVLTGQSVEWFVDRPNIINYRLTLPVVDAGRRLPRELIDIAANSVGVRRGASRHPFEVRLEQGVIDTVAEMLALRADLRSAENTASVFALAARQGSRGMVTTSRKAAALPEPGWPADVTARLNQDVEAGYVAVALEQPVDLGGQPRVGWWRIDPASGETIGVMDTGLHAAMVDKELTDQEVNAQWANTLQYARSNAPETYRIVLESRNNVIWGGLAFQILIVLWALSHTG